jgi:RNA polymerase sigma-70 factor (ECF subfamily)
METDEALFDALAQGDMRAFDRLYERFERPLFGFIRAQIGDAHEAEDIFHEAFMAVLRERGARHTVQSFRAWLFQVARNLCLNRLRSRRRAGRAFEVAAKDELLAHPAEPAQDALEHHEQAAALVQAVARLPPPLADVYRLRATGMSYDEVAHVLCVPLGTVKSRMNEMVRRLREEMSG